MKNKLPIFLINLDDSDVRLAAATTALQEQGLEFTRVSAHDGRNTDPENVPEYDRNASLGYIGRGMKGGEIGCFFSHVKAAQAFLETGAPMGLVLEDDIKVEPNCFDLLAAFGEWQTRCGAPDWKLAHLGSNKLTSTTQLAKIGPKGDQINVVRAHYFPMTTNALIWTRNGAKEFLDTSFPIDCPVDVFMRRWLTQTNQGIALSPALFQVTGAPSDIDAFSQVHPRDSQGRLRKYFWIKAKRILVDKLHAARHRVKAKLKWS